MASGYRERRIAEWNAHDMSMRRVDQLRKLTEGAGFSINIGVIGYCVLFVVWVALSRPTLSALLWVSAMAIVVSAIMSAPPRSRIPGLASCILWMLLIFFAVWGNHGIKYYPLIFDSACILLLLASTSAAFPKVAECMIPPVTFVEAAWLASLIRQIRYEYATVGHLTLRYDSCATALTPLVASILLLLISAFTCALFGCDALILTIARHEKATWETRLAFTHRLLSILAACLGLWYGLAHWVDWQINQPCL